MADNSGHEAAAVLLEARRHVLRSAWELERAAEAQRERARVLADMAARASGQQLPLPVADKAAPTA